MVAVEAARMSDKGVAVLRILLIAAIWWKICSMPDSKIDPTQCDIPTNSAELIEQVASVDLEDTQEMPIVPSPSDKPAKPEILIFVSKTCPPCEKWKRCEMQRFLDAGWSVGIIEVHRYPITPRYEINANGKQVDHVGYITFEQAKELAK